MTTTPEPEPTPAAWEAFDVIPSGRSSVLDGPTIRQIDDPVDEHGHRQYDWPDEEVHDGVAGIVIHVHGDDPGGAYVKVTGRTEDAVSAALANLDAWAKSGGLEALWP